MMHYAFCGKSGVKLPQISLGLWHNFGFADDFDSAQKMVVHAFDRGVTHFDLANNYGPPPGSAELNFGKIMKNELSSHRDEMIISSKAGHLMWNGPYGEGSSRKHLMASINQSLQRTGLDYFDVFYSHRYDPDTHIEETMQALIDIVRQGKALYIGLSKYPPAQAMSAMNYLKQNNVPCFIFQDRYNLFNRGPEDEILGIVEEFGIGFIAFSPLAQGLLTNKYLNGIPKDSRAANPHGFLKEEQITPVLVDKVRRLKLIAERRGQTVAEMALAWVLRDKRVTSLIVGARNIQQLDDNLRSLENIVFSDDELNDIDIILAGDTQ